MAIAAWEASSPISSSSSSVKSAASIFSVR